MKVEWKNLCPAPQNKSWWPSKSAPQLAFLGLKALRFSGNYGRNQSHFTNPPDWSCQNASNTFEYLLLYLLLYDCMYTVSPSIYLYVYIHIYTHVLFFLPTQHGTMTPEVGPTTGQALDITWPQTPEVISRQTVTETAQLRQEVEVLGAIVHGIFQWCFKDAGDGYPINFSLLFMVQWCIKMPFGNLTICYRQLSMSVGDLCWFYWFTQQKNVAVPFSTKNCWVSWGYFLVVTARPLPGASKNISPEHRHSVAPGSFGAWRRLAPNRPRYVSGTSRRVQLTST